MKSYLDIIDCYNLNDHYAWFCTHNESATLPYHNLFHANCMIENCYDGAQWHDLPYGSTRELLIAAMFHDFDHSGGKEVDHVNITCALTGLSQFFIQSDRGSGYCPDLIWQCIRCTEYPFVVEPFTIEQRIIRDADLMQFRYPNWRRMLEHKLREEMEVKVGKPISDDEMYDGNRNFWLVAKFYTAWGRKIFNTEGVDLQYHFKLISLGGRGGGR